MESAPQVGVYLPLYDYWLGRLWGPTGVYAPLLAGSIARLVAVMFSAPLERMQARFFWHLSFGHPFWHPFFRHPFRLLAPLLPPLIYPLEEFGP